MGRFQGIQPKLRKVSIRPTPNASFHPLFQGRQHPLCPDARFHPPPTWTGFSSLLSPEGHCRRLVFRAFGHRVSTFLHPFAPACAAFVAPDGSAWRIRSVWFVPPALPGFLATTGALTPVLARFFVAVFATNERRSFCPYRSPSFTSSNLPTIPSPTTCSRPWDRPSFRSRGLTAATAPRASHPLGRVSLGVIWASPWASRLATATGRIEFVSLRTGHSPAVALHLLSRERSYLPLQSLGPTLTRTFTSLIRCARKRTSRAFQGPGIPRAPMSRRVASRRLMRRSTVLAGGQEARLSDVATRRTLHPESCPVG